MTAADTPDALAFAHWHRVAQEAQREVARLTAERDEALSWSAAPKTAEADRDRLRRELDEALAGREREYARAEAEHDAAERIAAEWSDIVQRFQPLEPCPDCWGPMLRGGSCCIPCASAAPCARCAAPSQTTEGDERLCSGCAYDDSTAGGS